VDFFATPQSEKKNFLHTIIHSYIMFIISKMQFFSLIAGGGKKTKVPKNESF